MKWLIRLYNRITRRKIGLAEVLMPLRDGTTTEDAITVTVTGLRASLRELGQDMDEGNVDHHTHLYDGVPYHHAVWTLDAARRD